MRTYFIALTFLLAGNKSLAQALPQDSISKQTHVYAVKDSADLRLDVYRKGAQTGDSARPCVIFVFGGA